VTDRLSLYNGALRIIGERPLASLTEARKPRYVLDNVWDGGAVDYCLEQGFWNFALRVLKLEYSPTVEPQFGFKYAFEKPDDYIRTSGISLDEYLNSPLLDYEDSTTFWFASNPIIYVRYISDDNEYGYNLGGWPETFSKYVEGYLACEIVSSVTQGANKELNLDRKLKKLLTDAKSKDAMNQPPSFPQMGRWVRARMRGNTMRGYNRG
jgi:hypothetical protein